MYLILEKICRDRMTFKTGSNTIRADEEGLCLLRGKGRRSREGSGLNDDEAYHSHSEGDVHLGPIALRFSLPTRWQDVGI